LHGSPVRASIRLSANFTLRVASSSGFGSLAYYKRPIQTWFPCGSGLSPLASSMLKLVGSFFNRHAVTVSCDTASTPCRHMVSDLFHRPSGLLFTFPSRYLFTIGLEKYLDLPVSSGGFPRAFRVPGYLRSETKKIFYFNLRGYHPLGPIFPDRSANKIFCNFSSINGTSHPCNPHSIAAIGLVFSAFARRY
jgi:hypothetical protein